jgi:hypothetical protein
MQKVPYNTVSSALARSHASVAPKLAADRMYAMQPIEQDMLP